MEFSLDNRPDIVVFKDIIEEWSERTGKPKELLEDIYKHHTKYLIHTMENNDDAFTINLPNLGRMYMNHYFSTSLSDKSKESYLKRRKELYEITEKVKEKKLLTLHFNVPIMIRFSNLFQKIERPFTNFYNYVDFVEDINRDILKGENVTLRHRDEDRKKRKRKFNFRHSVEKARSL